MESFLHELRHARLDVAGSVAGKHGEAGAFARGVGQHLLALEEQPEIDDAAEHQEQDRQDERELDELGASLGPHARS